MRRILPLVFALAALLIPGGVLASADPASAGETYFRGLVVSVDRSGLAGSLESLESVQKVRVRALSGPWRGEELEIDQYFEIIPSDDHLVHPGEKVVVLRTEIAGGEQFFLVERYRLPTLIWAFLLFLAAAVAVGRWRGFTSALGLVFSVSVIALYIVPGIVDGRSPLSVSLIGAAVIAVFSIYLSHGLNRRTSVALASTLAALALAAALSLVFVAWARIFGLGSEESFYIQAGLYDIDLKGLLLGGIILGALGVLDDVTVAQSAAVEEIHRADPSLPFRELYRRGMSIGRDHIASMVNTLALAYFGASLPLFLIFALDRTKPFWVIMNSELIAEEAVRTLVGSLALLSAVPLSAVLAAYVFSRAERRKR